MKEQTNHSPATDSSRREFLKVSSAAALTGTLSIARGAHAAGSDEIRMALIGCGGRGTGAAAQALKTKANVKLIALADAFRNRLDVCNWIMRAHPVTAQGMGGRQVRIGPQYGEIFDHHAVEFTYEDGTKLFSFCRQIPDCWNSFSQHALGTGGSADINGHGRALLQVDGKPRQVWRRDQDGHQIEQDNMFAALAEGRPLNEADYGATSTMTAIMGRMATYSGKLVRWSDALESQLSLVPEQLAWNTKPPTEPGPDGIYPCAIPGVTKTW